ncbi:MAG: cytochrome PufQ [Pseudomonadota bacterium]
MTDHTMGMPPGPSRKPTWEYRLYFAIIFLISLPWAFVVWAFNPSAVAERGVSYGFIGLARRQALTITPMIFSA